MLTDHNLPLISESMVKVENTTYALMEENRDRRLIVQGNIADFTGDRLTDDTLSCPLTPENAKVLRSRLPWLNPVPLGLKTSAGFGDRLGIATPGHVFATRDTGVAPIFAQQSVRENARTGRTPQEVLDDAMWGVFQTGWRDAWGADADHTKNPEDIAPFVHAGYTFYTIDPSDYVDDASETDDLSTLEAKAQALPWDELQSSLEETRQRYLLTFNIDTLSVEFDERTLLKALAKYGAAVAHTLRMAKQIATESGDRPYELEMSVDETGTTTSLHEHFYIASELRRLNIPLISLAPKFAGRFEKGVDYIGDLDILEQNIAGHAAIMRYFDNSYKLSLHTGSDKFGVYPIAMRHTDGRVHLKTAGTSYLEALRLMAVVEPKLFRMIAHFCIDRYAEDRKTYHVSGQIENLPDIDALADSELPNLLNQFDARQVLHVTFGSVLDHFSEELSRVLNTHLAEYHQYIRTHFDKHLAAFRNP
jgi:tagaturonate epimerase